MHNSQRKFKAFFARLENGARNAASREAQALQIDRPSPDETATLTKKQEKTGGANMAEEKGSSIVFDNLIDASITDISTGIVKRVSVPRRASSFMNSNAEGVIGAMDEQAVAARADTFGALCKQLRDAQPLNCHQ